MRYKLAFSLLASAFLGACVRAPSIDASHPASPEATAASLPALSRTLADEGRAPAAQPPAMKTEAPAHEHERETGGAAPAAPSQVKRALYTCPMHPQIVRDKPGECPICGMTLVPKPEPAAKKGETHVH